MQAAAAAAAGSLSQFPPKIVPRTTRLGRHDSDDRDSQVAGLRRGGGCSDACLPRPAGRPADEPAGEVEQGGRGSGGGGDAEKPRARVSRRLRAISA